jgi:1-acyl-sn-glycerol-3-phosphate acyltransferase
MNIFKRIAGHIYFCYALIVFAATTLIVIIPTSIALLFEEPRRAKIIHPTYKIWMSIFLPLVGCWVFRRGKHHFAKGENYVVVVNHNSLADIPVSTPWIPGPNKTLAKIEMAKTPVFGVIYKAGSVLVDRKSESSRKESFTKMQETLKQGLHLCIYPEGTRNKTTAPLTEFQDGAFIVAIRAQKAIIPAVLFGTKEILPNKPAMWARPKSIRYHFLEPVPTKGLSMSDRNELKDKVHELMKNYIIQHS